MFHRFARTCCRCGLVVLLLLLGTLRAFSQAGLVGGPSGSGAFGTTVTVLPNGNYVVTDPDFDLDSLAKVGAAYLYDGTTNARLSTLTGRMANDHVGKGGVVVLANGNYLVYSPDWQASPAAPGAGAVTWGSARTGVSGAVSAANSLVGTEWGDALGLRKEGIYDIIALPNGHYVVASPQWHRGRGAVTWSNGTTGTAGTVSTANSLVGSAASEDGKHTADDQVGGGKLVVLANGNYVVGSPDWQPGTGAATWVSGTTGRPVGELSAANSLTGHSQGDYVGAQIVALTSGNYVVGSPAWQAGTGAATWGNGCTGTVGEVSATNSLVGTVPNTSVGVTILPLPNGHYVLNSPGWPGAGRGRGAVTWANGHTGGPVGAVTAANSLVGSSDNDQIGRRLVVLKNGNYVFDSPHWRNGSVAKAGAVTWGDGHRGTCGVVSAANSLVGTRPDDQIGSEGITALPNGHYVVASPQWHNARFKDRHYRDPYGEYYHQLAHVGAVTWGNGCGGTIGAISAANSLTGSGPQDKVGSGGVKALTNGNYVVVSPDCYHGQAAFAGAVTWGRGTGGTVGAVSAANSLVAAEYERLGTEGCLMDTESGSWSLAENAVESPDGEDHAWLQTGGVGWLQTGGVLALPNGNYVVSCPTCPNGAIPQAGAVAWGNGQGGTVGSLSAANALVGSSPFDHVGAFLTPLPTGNYVVDSPYWDGPNAAADAGAATWGNGTGGLAGAVSAANSLVGTHARDGVGLGSFAGAGTYALPTGDYVVCSPRWHGRCAATWGNGRAGTAGPVSAENSLVGGAPNDFCYVSLLPDSTHYALTLSHPTRFGHRQTLVLPTTERPAVGCNDITDRNDYDNVAFRPATRTLLIGRPAENCVQVDLGPPPAPTGAARPRLRRGTTVADLQAAGRAVRWYAAPTGGPALSPATPLARRATYYASQTVGGCESPQRLAVRVKLR